MRKGRPVKIEPDFKVCTICKVEKPKESYRLEPRLCNPHNRRNQCTDCRNALVRERHRKNDTYKKQYRAMSEEERARYIKYKSEMNQIRFKTKPEALERKRNYDKSDKGVFNRYANENKRRNRLERGLTFELSFEQVKDLINQPCTYCGAENCRGIDRVDTNVGYTPDNCVPCCRVCNAMKNNLSLDQFKDHIFRVASKFNKQSET